MREELPEGWVRVELGNLLTEPLSNGRSVRDRAGGFPVLRLTALRRGLIDPSAYKEGEWTADEARPFLVRSGDFLVARGNGSLGLVGAGGLVGNDPPAVAYPDTLIRVRVEQGVCLPTFFRHLWQSPLVRTQIEKAARTTAGIYKVNQADLRMVRLPLPPPLEQRRIVTGIEEQLSRLDNAVRLIESALRRLPLVRRAVLGNVMPDPLPAGWKLLTVEEAGTVELGRQRSPKYHSGPNMKPYLRVANVHEDRIDLGDVKEMDFPPEQVARHELRPGDILLNEGNGSPELVGSPAMYRGELPGACFTNSLIRFRPFEFVDGDYALLVFLRHLRFGRFRSAAQITTIAHMAAGRFKRVEFPLPPLDEQDDIVQAVRRQLSLLDAFEAELRTALRRSDSLRRAILGAAFRGELVPQDPTDEPAADLLRRIAAERPAPPRGNRRKNGA